MAIRVKRQTEAEFTRTVIDVAHLFGWLCAHFRGVRVQRNNGSTYWQTPVQGDGAGFPDCVFVHPAQKRVIVAELKIPPNKCTPEQTAWLQAFEVCGVPAYVWTPGEMPEIQRTLERGGEATEAS